jgi:uncharacterized protein YecE (DUF72 family)
MAKVWIGTSGWAYGSWKRRFYPPTLADSHRLEYYAQHFMTTEVNYSYYHVPSLEMYRKWAATVPPEFLFAVKTNRAISHDQRLRNVEEIWNDFMQGAMALGQHLGPILVQLPPSFARDHARLDDFLRMTSDLQPRVRLTVEFRHRSWFTAETYRLLVRHRAAFCIGDGMRHPRANVATADFAYLRFHGRTPREAPCYTDRELEKEATYIEALVRQGIDAFVYFNNDAGAHAIANAGRLKTLLPGICIPA